MASGQTLAALLIGLTLCGAVNLRMSPKTLADELSANEEVLVNPAASKVGLAMFLTFAVLVSESLRAER